MALSFLGICDSGGAVFKIADGDVAALKSAINIANTNGEDDTIELAVNGTYTVTVVDNYYVNALPALVGDGGHSLTIHGNGATLQRSTDSTTPPLRFFSVSAGVTLIIDALTMFGADLRYANGDTSTVCGAAIYNHGGTVTISNSTFRANRANYLGGAIYNDGEYDATSLTLTNCVLENNSANVGGAISSYSPSPSITVAIDQCTFSGNTATGPWSSGGGAINIDGSGASVNVTIDHSTFSHNSAFSPGGGVICNRGGNVMVMESSFLQNYGYEGGVAYNNGATGATLVLSHCTVSGNSESAIANHGNRGNALAVIRDSTFVDNYNPYDGGAIWNGGDYGTATTRIENCIFIRNAANTGGAIYSNGFDYGRADLTVTNTTFDTNSANEGGGAIFTSAYSTTTTTCDITSCTFNNNFAVSGISIGDDDYPSEGLLVRLRNNIFQTWTHRQNLAGYPGTIVSMGHNLTNDDGSGVLNAAGDQIDTDALLDPLGPQNNGGPTQTIALLAESPAIDAGDVDVQARDQRYYVRSGVPDIGAFEYQGTLAPLQAVSRKTHGATGMFDIDLPLSGPSGIECRSGSANGQHRIVLNFSTPVVFQSASIITGIGEVIDANVNGSEVTVDLAGVANAQEIMLRLSEVSDGTHQNNVDIPMGLLLGDVDASSAVNASDVTVIKGQLAQPVTDLNFRADVNASGAIDASDLALAKSQLGLGVP